MFKFLKWMFKSRPPECYGLDLLATIKPPNFDRHNLIIDSPVDWSFADKYDLKTYGDARARNRRYLDKY